MPEGLGEHTDREYEKIEKAFIVLQALIDALDVRVTALEP
jgi:hypothetical protein